MTVRVEIPMTLPSVANLREHWATKAKRVKAQRNAVRLAMKTKPSASDVWWEWHPKKEPEWTLDTPLVVTLTRVAPRALDSDNLVSAFKACRDSIAACFGVNDNDPRIEWHYGQSKGPAAVVLEFDVRAVGVVDPGPEAVAE